MRDLPARPVVRRFTRLLTALAAAIGLTWLPVATVDACTCLGWTFPQSIRAANMAAEPMPADAEVSDAGWASNVPLPVLVAGAGALVILAASALAFRKPRPG
jgi:hypothetical protein